MGEKHFLFYRLKSERFCGIINPTTRKAVIYVNFQDAKNHTAHSRVLYKFPSGFGTVAVWAQRKYYDRHYSYRALPIELVAFSDCNNDHLLDTYEAQGPDIKKDII